MFLDVCPLTSGGWKTPCVHGQLGEMVVRGSGHKECVAASRGRAPGSRKRGCRECVTKKPDRLGWEKASEKWALEGESERELGRGLGEAGRTVRRKAGPGGAVGETEWGRGCHGVTLQVCTLRHLCGTWFGGQSAASWGTRWDAGGGARWRPGGVDGGGWQAGWGIQEG